MWLVDGTWSNVVAVTCRCALLLLAAAVVSADGARILLMVPVGGKSQKNIFYGLGKELASRGHDVVFFNGFKPSSPVPGIKEIVPVELAEHFRDENFPNAFRMMEAGPQTAWDQMKHLLAEGPRIALASKELDDIINQDWDLVIFGGFGYPFYFIPYVKQTPFMILTPVGYVPFITGPLGSPTIPAAHPFPLGSSTDHMDFFERVKCFLGHLVAISLLKYVYIPYCDSLVGAKFGIGTMPPASEIERNVSLILLSSHPTMDYHKPLLPNAVEVGGVHCTEPSPLPAELQQFLGNSEFIFFSLGSVVRPGDMSADQRDAVLAALGSVPFKVLLKWNTTDRAGIPKNILPSKWLPQQDILGDKRCRLFISHGGLASFQESVCHGVPLLTMPVTGDHIYNANRAVKFGVAEMLHWEDLTAASLKRAIQAAMMQDRVAAVQYRQRIFNNQPVHPRALAAYWVEQAVENRGLPHLRSVAADLNFFQYYSLDVIAFLLAAFVLVIKLVVALVKCSCRLLCRRTGSTQPQPVHKIGKRAKRE